MTRRPSSSLSLLVLALLGGCATTEPQLAGIGWHSETTTVEDLDAAVGAAAARLGYIPIRHVVAGEYRGRAVAEGDEAHVEAEARPRAQVIWSHVVPRRQGGAELVLDVLSRDRPGNSSFAHELAAAVKERVPDLQGGSGSSTGLGYDPGREPQRLEVPPAGH